MLTNLYYRLRPFVPRAVQIAIRRQIVRRKRRLCSDVWPIDERTGTAPEGWTGWPDGKKFAFVITHDVETAKGVERCRQLAQIDSEYGFRSSFNFVAEGYEIPDALRAELEREGFEVGVHGLIHRCNLYESRKRFEAHAKKINHYLKEWNCAGFRTPSMYHNLEWLKDLHVEYDSSTFDTDPFEPQPDALGTIFPKWIGSNGAGFVELPYTLPQDYMLFVVMKEATIDIWKRKLDWIAQHGGMALLLTHPDYVNFKSIRTASEFPLEYYKQFLQYARLKYEGQFWHVLPREVAKFWSVFVMKNSGQIPTDSQPPTQSAVRPIMFPPSDLPGVSVFEQTVQPSSVENPESSLPPTCPSAMRTGNDHRDLIWIDLDNSPHVPFFDPIIRELRKQDFNVLLTARDCSQTCGLADLFEMKYRRIGRHYGKNRLLKVVGTILRAAQLSAAILPNRPAVAVSHGSRAQMMSALFLGVPSIAIMDYEHVKGFVRPTWIMMPKVIRGDSLRFSKNRVLKYPGIKEDVYVPFFKPDPTILTDLGIRNDELLVTIRPPATEAHYHNPEAEALFRKAVNRIGPLENSRMVILPRNDEQKAFIKNVWPNWCSRRKIVVPENVVDGLNLLWHSDFAISGGGTMNREAAALRVPVYSIFRGKIGDVDRYLVESGRLIMLESLQDVDRKLKICKRKVDSSFCSANQDVLDSVVKGIIHVVETCR